VHWRALARTGVLLRALACSGVNWRALACTGVLWRALSCSGVQCYAELKCLTIEIHYPTIELKNLMIFKNSNAVMCVFLKLFVHDFVKVDPTQSLCHRYEELK
jgi:hypothetical protein